MEKDEVIPVSSDTPKPTIRQRLTRNAEQFDEIVTELLAENARLNAALSAIPTTSGDGWIDVNNETKLAEGFMRLYSFKPVINEKRPDCNLRRAYDFSRILGSRERDMYLDIPIPQPKEGNNEH